MSNYRCIFCQVAEKLSREHIYANWLRKYLPRPNSRSTHFVSHLGQIGKGKLDRPGDFHAQRLQVVCKRCNSGWMSGLQTAAKHLLIPLLRDEPWPNLHELDQLVLARWAAMFSMVHEYADPKSVAVPQEHRTHLMNSATLPPNWFVYIGRVHFDDQHPGCANHHGASLIYPQDDVGLSTRHNFQTTSFTVGRCLFHTMMLDPAIPILRIASGEFAFIHDLRVIHPYGGVISGGPTTLHNRKSFYVVSNADAASMGMPTFETTKG